MKKIFYLLALWLFVSVFIACEHEDVTEQVTNETESSLHMESELSLRALSLGYSDTTSYITNVHQQCLAGNHTNCDLLADGSHQPCTHSSHNGTKHDGTHFTGTGSDSHNSNHHNGSNGDNHDMATCADPLHNHGNNTHDVNTCTDISHNHNTDNNHDINTCKDASHNHGKHNNGHH